MTSLVIDDVALLKCSICLDVYRKPKLLRCGHTFCEECLTQLQLSSRESGAADFACPECRENVVISPRGIEHLAPNFTIQRLLDERKRSNNTANARAQADNDVDSLTRLVFQLMQSEKSLEDAGNRFLVAVSREEAAIRQRGDQVKARVDDDVAKLVEQLRALRDDHVSRVGARRKRVETETNAATSLCSAYAEARSGGRTPRDERIEQRKLNRLHAATERLLQHETDDEDALQSPRVVFTPTSTADRSARNLVGQLDQVSEAESTGKSNKFESWAYSTVALAPCVTLFLPQKTRYHLTVSFILQFHMRNQIRN